MVDFDVSLTPNGRFRKNSSKKTKTLSPGKPRFGHVVLTQPASSSFRRRRYSKSGVALPTEKKRYRMRPVGLLGTNRANGRPVRNTLHQHEKLYKKSIRSNFSEKSGIQISYGIKSTTDTQTRTINLTTGNSKAQRTRVFLSPSVSASKKVAKNRITGTIKPKRRFKIKS